MIREKINTLLDSLPDEELKHVYWSVISIKENYDYNQNLLNKGISIDYIEESSKSLLEKWDQTFATVSEQTKKEIYYDSFIWHLYSYEKLPHLSGEEAIQAFNQLPKKDIYFSYQHDMVKDQEFVQVFKNAQDLVARDIENQQDVYLFDDTFSWTYIQTHESMCGPYFVQIKKS